MTEERRNRRTTTVKSNGLSRGALPATVIMTRAERRAVVDGLDIGRPQGCRGNALGFHEPLAEPRLDDSVLGCRCATSFLRVRTQLACQQPATDPPPGAATCV
jgi:hypothetical protein